MRPAARHPHLRLCRRVDTAPSEFRRFKVTYVRIRQEHAPSCRCTQWSGPRRAISTFGTTGTSAQRRQFMNSAVSKFMLVYSEKKTASRRQPSATATAGSPSVFLRLVPHVTSSQKLSHTSCGLSCSLVYFISGLSANMGATVIFCNSEFIQDREEGGTWKGKRSGILGKRNKKRRRNGENYQLTCTTCDRASY